MKFSDALSRSVNTFLWVFVAIVLTISAVFLLILIGVMVLHAFTYFGLWMAIPLGVVLVVVFTALIIWITANYRRKSVRKSR